MTTLRSEAARVAEQLCVAAERLGRALEADPGAGAGGVPLADRFRLPMQNLDKEWYEATRRYGSYNYHPGRCEDWNLESGGNTDLGEPIVAPFSGLILSAYNWHGSIGRAIQMLGITPDGEVIAWGGWHLHEMAVEAGQVVEIGAALGSIGNADGYYAGAHLHEQICVVNALGVPRPELFPGSDGRYGWKQPSRFYIEHGVDQDLVEKCARWK